MPVYDLLIGANFNDLERSLTFQSLTLICDAEHVSSTTLTHNYLGPPSTVVC